MVNDIQHINATVLERELNWLENVIDTRLNIYFEQSSQYKSVFEIVPPLHLEHDAPYVQFIHYYKMDVAERIALALALAPHVKPSLLDAMFKKNNEKLIDNRCDYNF